MESISEDLSIPLPIFDGKNFHHWGVKMRVIFNFHEVLEIVEDGISDVEESASKEKDRSALSLIQQSVNSENLEKIVAAKIANEAWDTLQQMYHGAKWKNQKLKGAEAEPNSNEGSNKKGGGSSNKPTQNQSDKENSISSKRRNLVQKNRTDNSVSRKCKSNREKGEEAEKETECTEKKDEDSNENSKTRPLTNLSLKTLDSNEREGNMDTVEIGSWKVKESTKEEAVLPEIRVWKNLSLTRLKERKERVCGIQTHIVKEENGVIAAPPISVSVSPEKISNLGVFPKLGFETSRSTERTEASPTTAEDSKREYGAPVRAMVAEIVFASPDREEIAVVREKLMLDRLVARIAYDEIPVEVKMKTHSEDEEPEFGFYWKEHCVPTEEKTQCVAVESDATCEKKLMCNHGEGRISFSVCVKCVKKPNLVKSDIRVLAIEIEEEDGSRERREGRRVLCSEKLSQGWVKHFDLMGLSPIVTQFAGYNLNVKSVGLRPVQAQFGFKRGSGSKAKKLITLGQTKLKKVQILAQFDFSSEYVDQAQCFQKSDWVNVGLQAKQWDPGIIFVVPN